MYAFLASTSFASETLKSAKKRLTPVIKNLVENALVNPAKSRSGFFEQINAETGEIQQLTLEKRTSEKSFFLL